LITVAESGTCCGLLAALSAMFKGGRITAHLVGGESDGDGTTVGRRQSRPARFPS
jgi:hypothetical protein